MEKRNPLRMGKKGAYDVSKMANNLIEAIIAVILVLAIMAGTVGLLYVFLGNVTTAITANDTSGLGTAFVIILPILLLVGIFGAVAGAIALVKFVRK